MLVQNTHHQFTASEYLELYEKDVLPGTPQTELINGEIIELSPLGNKHARTQILLLDFLREIYGKDLVYVTGSILINETNMPEPDLYVMKPAHVIENNYPLGSQVELVVEVGDSTINAERLNDGEGRLGIYASSGIPVVLVIDVPGKAIYEFSEPEGARYSECLVHQEYSTLFNQSIDVNRLIA